VTLVEEGLAAMRGCWRLIWRDPRADEDFNLTIDGFWRSFAMVLPAVSLAYPYFVLGDRFAADVAVANSLELPASHVGLDYLVLLAGLTLWPVAAAILARTLNTGQAYVRYMIIYNWMTLPALVVGLIPYLVYSLTGALNLAVILAYAVFVFLLYLSWYVAKAGLQTTAIVALAFLAAEYALTYGLSTLIR